MSIFVAAASSFIAAGAGFDIIDSVVIGLLTAAFYLK